MPPPEHSPGPIEVHEVVEPTDELLDAYRRLIPQLSPSATPPSRERLEELVADSRCTILVARLPDHDPSIVGSVTLVAYPLPSGGRVWIEDVVVDSSARGRGVGEALVRAALERAARTGARAVDLTSNPTREAAHRLYRRLGFVLRDTSAYRYHLSV